MTIDPTISAGTIIGVASIVVTVFINGRLERRWQENQLNELKVSLRGFESTQAAHKESITEHSERMRTQDQLVAKLIADVNKLIGISLRGSQLRSTDT